MVRDFAIADDMFEARELIGENGGEEILGIHALQRRGVFATATVPWNCQGARGVPAPADGEHRRVEQGLNEQLANSFGIQVAKNFFEREGMLRAERKDDGIIRRGRLQLEVERATKAFAQRQAPHAVQTRAKQ